ncbi:hypothetical protein INT48_000694 [Thamnidium elegans]|uniref:Uncharacterized protein n=1 Tax=Thamnidium elegans TaxID=101142 RepID=A0A8H7SYS8_9FUNG|nr:hypothetical protein INT48_000694 [Thamnidium elegans]
MKKTQEAKNLGFQVKELRKQVECLNKKLKETEESALSLKVKELQNLLNKANKALSEKSSGTSISPLFMNKIKNLKADHAFLKNENKYLKEKIKRNDLSKHQTIEYLLSSEPEDDCEDLYADAGLNYSSNKFTNVTIKRHDKSPPPYQRTSSSSSCKSSTSTSQKSCPTKQKDCVHDVHVIYLDTPSPDNEQSDFVRSIESLPALCTAKDKYIVPKRKAEFRIAGLEVPPPNMHTPISTGHFLYKKIPNKSSSTNFGTKKPARRLGKFVNSRNPSKVIDSKPLIYRAKKRELPPEEAESSGSMTAEEHASKKQKSCMKENMQNKY